MWSFLNALAERPLVCDGAMGTMLCTDGAYVNRAVEELNVTAPDRVAAVHDAYRAAGVDVVETNTFGANRVRLGRFGLANRLAELNLAGLELARRAAGDALFVAGAIGPLGVALTPAGRTTPAEAEAYFREQADVLETGGVDLFVLETFGALDEALAAVRAVQTVSGRPVVAQMTTGGGGNVLEGTAPEAFGRALAAAGVDVVGVNCGTGPAEMLETIARLDAALELPLAAQPNAGLPRVVEGQVRYLWSPDDLASYARRFVGRGVRLVGGCCGTTPEHIRHIKRAVRAAV